MSQMPRVCIIGCGPSGMSALYHMTQLPEEKRPDIVCYEKQSTWGGLWNLTWRTGTDEFGEAVHSGMYPELWTNYPKECMEYHDYTWEEHFGKAVPSYLPNKLVQSYMEGRLTSRNKRDLKSYVRFSTVVRRVEHNTDTDTFTVLVHHLLEDKEELISNFTHVIVASGIFSVANVPAFPGMDIFKGRILHSCDFREVSLFPGKKILILGAGRAAKDLAVTGVKFGADRIICSWKTSTTTHEWPEGVEKRPTVERFGENRAYFRDGSSADIDVVIYCTGYYKNYPFLSDGLRLKSELPVSFYPDNLYKGIVWTKGGNGKLLYLGAQGSEYSLTLFDAQAYWVCKYIAGDIKLPDTIEMLNDIEKWKQRCDLCVVVRDYVDFQTEYVRDLCEIVGYITNYADAKKLHHDVLRHKAEKFGLFTYRDEQFVSIHTGTLSPKPETPWMKSFDSPYKAFVNQNVKPNSVR